MGLGGGSLSFGRTDVLFVVAIVIYVVHTYQRVPVSLLGKMSSEINHTRECCSKKKKKNCRHTVWYGTAEYNE